MKLLYHPLATLVITGLVLILCTSLYFNSREIGSSKQAVEGLEATVAQEQKNLEKLEKDVKNAQSPLTKEKIMRDQLLLQKPGEYVVQIPDVPTPSPTPAPRPVVKTPWQEWQNLLF